MMIFETGNSSEPAQTRAERLEALIERVGLDDDLQIAAMLSAECYDRLPYHDFDHALGVAERSIDLADQENLTRNSKQILLLAALWHDAYFAYELQDEDPSKEHRSARLAYEAILLTVDEDNLPETVLFAQEVYFTILSTNIKCDSFTNLGLILNTADLANLYSDDTSVMLKETGALYLEKLFLEGNSAISDILATVEESKDQIEAWTKDARFYVEELVRRKLKPGSKHALKALANLKHMNATNLLQQFKYTK